MNPASLANMPGAAQKAVVIVLYVIGAWFFIGVVAAALFSLWLRSCGHHDPAERTGDDIAKPKRPQRKKAEALRAPPTVETIDGC